jgi:predicted NAD/FAD-dependent oxidoreductase
MKKINSVAIIGAGIAGLSCASVLQQAGIRVRVFEKSRGVGGRMSTRLSEDWECDHGAQYFTASDQRFAKTVAQWCSIGAAQVWNPRLAVLGGVRQTRPTQAVVRYVGTPRMTSPASAIVQSSALSTAIQTSSTVCEIYSRAASWALSLRESGEIDETFDHLVFAIPQPQVAALIKSQEVSWRGELNQVEMLPCWALMTQVESGAGPNFDAAFVNEGPLGWLCCNSSKPQRTGHETWIAHATTAWSQEHIEHASEPVQEILGAEFERVTGSRLRSARVHRWRYAQSLSALQGRYLLDDQRGLSACGDWANGDKVEGAWLSGYHLANALMR